MLSSTIASQNVGISDTGAPSVSIDCFVNDPVLTSSVLFYITFSKGPIVGLVVGDFTLVNCTLSSFTNVSNNIYSVIVNPQINGNFSVSLPANRCTYNNVNNLASNVLTKVYNDGATYNLENAALIEKADHYRGHLASFSDVTDTNFVSGEMFCCRENISGTLFDPSTTQSKKDIYTFGRIDFGEYLHVNDASGGDYPIVDPQITLNRNGDDATCLSYGGGVTTYALNMRDKLLGGRNSDSEHNGHQEISYSSGLTDAQLISRASTIRFEYYGKSTAGDFFAGTWEQGVTKLNTIIPLVISSGGWYVNFSHWYKVEEDYLPEYFKVIRSILGSQDIASIPYGTALEYYWVREAIDTVSGSGGTVTIDYSKKYPSSPYSKISTPAWIKLDLTGTVFENEDIAVSNGGKIRSVGNNVYYISCLLDFNTTSVNFNIGITTSPTYVNLTQPVISRTGNSVTTDQACKLALYSLTITSVGTSVSGITIPTSHPGTVSLTTNTGLSIVKGRVIKLYNDSTHYICGVVLSYDSITGALVVTSYSNIGTGTFSSWTVYAGGYEIALTLAEKKLTSDVSFTLSTSLTITTRMFWLAAINGDQASSVIQF